MIDKKVAGSKKHHIYVTMTSIGDAWLFKVRPPPQRRGEWRGDGACPCLAQLACPVQQHAQWCCASAGASASSGRTPPDPVEGATGTAAAPERAVQRAAAT